MSLEEQIKSNCGKLPYDRITIWRFKESELTKIGRGIVFIFATWSGHSVTSFQHFCSALAEAPTSKLAIFVMDADGFDFDAFKNAFGELPQGKGEVYWIRNGQVVYRDPGYTEETKETLQERIREFTENMD